MILTSKAAFRETFGSTRWREGYQFQQVDAFVDEIVETLLAWERNESAEPTGRDRAGDGGEDGAAGQTGPAGQTGQTGQADPAEQTGQTGRGGRPWWVREDPWPRVRVSAQDVVDKMFRATRFQDGYEQEDVDLFLDDVVETLRHYESAADGVDGASAGDATDTAPV